MSDEHEFPFEKDETVRKTFWAVAEFWYRRGLHEGRKEGFKQGQSTLNNLRFFFVFLLGVAAAFIFGMGFDNYVIEDIKAPVVKAEQQP